MKKLIVVLALGLVSLGANTAAAKTLTYGTYLSATHNVVTEALEPYFKAVSNAVDGSLSFRIFTDGTVVGGSDAFPGVRSDLVDMALLVPAYSPALVPATSALSLLPIFPTNVLVGTAAINELILLNCDQCLAEWRKAEVKPLAFYSSSSYRLMCTQKVNDLASLQGLRSSGTGPWANWLAAMGAVPVGLAGGEIYSGLNRGTVTCAMGSLAWLKTYGLMDVVNYVLDMPMSGYRPVSQMNMALEDWKSLSRDQQRAITSHLAELTANTAWSYRKQALQAVAEARKKGVTFVAPGEELKQRFETFLASERGRFIRTATQRGVDNPEMLLNRYQELLEEWKAIIAGIDTKSEYASALEEHIFSKVEY